MPGNRRLGEVDIFSVDYSDAFGTNASIDEISTQLARDSKFRQILGDYNHVFIVTHSLGGLVVKNLLLRFRQMGQAKFVGRVIGVALLGVPSNGAPLADLAKSKRTGDWGRIATYFFGDNWSLVDDLRSADKAGSFLRSLERQWEDLVKNPRPEERPLYVACGYETKPEVDFADLTIVSSLFAKTMCTGERYPINKGHTELGKPTGPDKDKDDAHEWLLSELAAALDLLDKTAIRAWQYPDVALIDLIERIEKAHKLKDDETGLPFGDETISLTDADRERLRHFFVRPPSDGYKAPTYAELLKKISANEGNKCLAIVIGERRRKVGLAIEQVVECKTSHKGVPDLACRPESCPLQPLRFDSR